MAELRTCEISPKYHKLISNWQKSNFPELGYLEKHWTEYYPKQAEFALISKIGELKHKSISIGRYKDQEYFEAANDMSGNMFYSAQGIIKAQCSHGARVGAAAPHERGPGHRRQHEVRHPPHHGGGACGTPTRCFGSWSTIPAWKKPRDGRRRRPP